MAQKREPRPEEIKTVNLKTALSERYLAYALSTITSRSLPDVRDGMKPVQRRILYAMRELKLDPASGYKKCARVVGDVIGKYHPHGDTAVYDALVRLAQSFSLRYPLVDGQGNFGNVDGDNAAAMRYTESRLTEIAALMLAGIDQDTVDFRDTYDGSDSEPVILPAAFPNLLANGATGIAVGMATSIPPHHAGELFDALDYLLSLDAGSPPPPASSLMALVKGPDLPTGGVIIEDETTIAQVYETGRGSLRLRANWKTEKTGHGQYQIVIDEIPYQVQKAKLIEKMADLLSAKKLPLLGTFKDESADDIRIVLTPKNRTVPAELLMEQLFRQSELETRLSYNMNVLDRDGIPKVMGLTGLLLAFIDHRMDVLIRRSNFRLAKINDRLEVLEGYIKAYLDIDEVIRIIREYDAPKKPLMERFDLNERQAEAVLNLRLRQLRKLEEMELKKEQEALLREKSGLHALLGSEKLRRKKLQSEMKEAKQKTLDERRTKIAGAVQIEPSDYEIASEKYPVTVICSKQGWVRIQKGDVSDKNDIKYKEGDQERFVFAAQSTDKLLIFDKEGRCYHLQIDTLPSGRGMGAPLSTFCDLHDGTSILSILIYESDGEVLLASRHGYGFLAPMKEIASQTRTGKQVMVPSKGDEVKTARSAPKELGEIAILGTNRKLIIFDRSELPQQKKGRGVILQRYREGELGDAAAIKMELGFTWSTGSRNRHEKDLGPWKAKRGGLGKPVPTGYPRKHEITDQPD